MESRTIQKMCMFSPWKVLTNWLTKKKDVTAVGLAALFLPVLLFSQWCCAMPTTSSCRCRSVLFVCALMMHVVCTVPGVGQKIQIKKSSETSVEWHGGGDGGICLQSSSVHRVSRVFMCYTHNLTVMLVFETDAYETQRVRVWQRYETEDELARSARLDIKFEYII